MAVSGYQLRGNVFLFPLPRQIGYGKKFAKLAPSFYSWNRNSCFVRQKLVSTALIPHISYTFIKQKFTVWKFLSCRESGNEDDRFSVLNNIIAKPTYQSFPVIIPHFLRTNASLSPGLLKWHRGVTWTHLNVLTVSTSSNFISHWLFFKVLIPFWSYFYRSLQDQRESFAEQKVWIRRHWLDRIPHLYSFLSSMFSLCGTCCIEKETRENKQFLIVWSKNTLLRYWKRHISQTFRARNFPVWPCINTRKRSGTVAGLTSSRIVKTVASQEFRSIPIRWPTAYVVLRLYLGQLGFTYCFTHARTKN